ncbi:MAG: DUF1848 family protein [Polyangiaceae bacterium]|nr:DUF1848 family protein [Polyangiaceae bacterium]
MATIISASRRTDIPRYFAGWFAERRRQGFAEFRTAFGVAGRVSLRPDDVLGYLFWTRHARPFAAALAALSAEGVPHAFQYTLTGYGRELEPTAPPLCESVDDFLRVSAALPDPGCIEWRYDPIVLSATCDAAHHRRSFGALARVLAGATRVVNVSVVEPYLRAVSRIPDPSVRYRRPDPRRHATVVRRFPGLAVAGSEATALCADLAAIAAEHGMALRVCSNPELDAARSQCCGPELFRPWGAATAARLAALCGAPTRPGCRCLATVDIGTNDTCVAACRYCYAVRSHAAAVASYRRHDPGAPALG